MCGEHLITLREGQTRLSAGRRSGSSFLAALRRKGWLRFLFFGVGNTLLTFSVFIALGLVLPAATAYAIAFVLGIIAVSTLSNRLIYRGKESWRNKVSYAGWYLFLFLIGQLVIYLTAPVGLRDLVLVSVLLLSITVPLTYLGGKIIFRTHRSRL